MRSFFLIQFERYLIIKKVEIDYLMDHQKSRAIIA